MSINWNNIRPLENFQNDAFEELVCQLARKENISNKKIFIRKGKSDAGVECFWILENNDEIAWQAIFSHDMVYRYLEKEHYPQTQEHRIGKSRGEAPTELLILVIQWPNFKCSEKKSKLRLHRTPFTISSLIKKCK